MDATFNPMTLPNLITLFRLFLIPVFVLFAVYYGRSVATGSPHEWQRLAAIIVFIVAAVSDCLDGYLARKWHQQSKLGTVLDPIADKGLLLTAIITLTLSNWTYMFPLWFPVVVIARDVFIVVGYFVLRHFNSHLEVRPSLLGKSATAAQMVALAWVMLQLPFHLYPIWIAGILTVISGLGYIIGGMRQLHPHDS
ncbi:MAG TPA: CDP-diacylglycerol--glycerol-3-phosphate 3-phosphatidyltransferase [Chthoniobacterales bacterium]